MRLCGSPRRGGVQQVHRPACSASSPAPRSTRAPQCSASVPRSTCGPGLVRFAGPRADAVLSRWPEVVAAPSVAETGRVQAWVVGPGMGTDGEALGRLRDVLDADEPVLVDADGLTLLAQQPGLLSARSRRGRSTVLTPHSGEFARLFTDLDPADRLGSAPRGCHPQRGDGAAQGPPHDRRRAVRSHRGQPVGFARTRHRRLRGRAVRGRSARCSPPVSMLSPRLPSGPMLHGRAGELAAAAGRPGAQHLWDYLAPAHWRPGPA